SLLSASTTWVDINPHRAQAHFFKSLAASRLSMHALALQEMSEAARLKGLTDFTRLVNGFKSIKFETKATYKQVVMAYNARLLLLLAQHPSSYDIPLALSLLAIQQDRAEDAKKMALLARDNGKENPLVLEFTIEVFEGIAANEEIKGSYELLLALNPDDIRLRHRYALFLTTYDNQQALEQLAMVVAMQPDNGDYLFHLSLLYMETSQIPEAIQALTRLQLIDGYASDAYYYLGLLALEQGNASSAESYLQQVESGHLLVRRHHALLQIYFTQKRYLLAVEQSRLLTPLLESEAALAKNYLTQSSLFVLLGDYDSAHMALDTLAELNENQPQVYYRRAMIYRQQGLMSKSEVAMKRFIALNPTDAEAMHLLGRWLAEDASQYVAALAWLKKASKEKPENVAILDDIGWVLYQLGRVGEAKSYLAKAQLLSEDANVAAHFAEVLWRSGEQGRAELLLKEAYAQSPSDKVLADTIRRLDVVFD
ncbi:MAG: tetratricopeptide repeat protein, partial [Sinobacterium sp.]|nr:tetratricopeptide repeat protein [Sinobacterium sp.]